MLAFCMVPTKVVMLVAGRDMPKLEFWGMMGPNLFHFSVRLVRTGDRERGTGPPVSAKLTCL